MESFLRRIVGADLLITPAVHLVVIGANECILHEHRSGNGLWGSSQAQPNPDELRVR
jgi:hypothetical protein